MDDDQKRKAEANQAWVRDKIRERGMERETRIKAVKRLPQKVINQVFTDIMDREFAGTFGQDFG